MTRLRQTVLVGAILALSAGCTSYQASGSIPIRPSSAPPIALFSPLEGAQLRAELSDTGLSGIFIQQSTNDGASMWRAPDDSALVFYRGILSATYSLGFDLYSADVTETAALIVRQQSGTATRVHRYLDGENQVVTRAFRCNVSVGKKRSGRYQVTEACRGTDVAFVNTYNVFGAGKILSSLQWVGPEVGFLRLTPLSNSRSNSNDVIVIAN